MEYKKILIINLGGIGDFLLSMPALKALKLHYKESKIDFLSVPRISGLADDLPYFNKRYTLDLSSLVSIKNILTLLKIRLQKYDLAVNMRTMVSMESAEKIKWLIKMINPKHSAGRNTEGWGGFFDIKIEETLAGKKYERDYDIELVEALGSKVEDRNIDLKIDEEALQKIEGLLGGKDMIVGVHPGGMPSRQWGAENFIETIKKIQNQCECNFTLTGGTNEFDLADSIAVKTNAVNLAGKLNLKELIALISRCNIFISNDTGPMHIAAILKIPLAAILGPGDIIRYDPRNISDKAVVLYKKADCAPCDKHECADKKCLKNITVAEVTAAVLKLLE